MLSSFNATVSGTTDYTLDMLSVVVRDRVDARAALTVVGGTTCSAGSTTCTLTYAVTVSDYYTIDITDTGEPAPDSGTLSAPSAVKLYYMEVSYYLTSSYYSLSISS